MFCTNCGFKFEDGNLFCPNCGTKVESIAQPVAEPAPVAAPVEAAPVQAAPIEAEPVQAAPVEAVAPVAVPVAAAAVAAAPVAPAPAPAPAPTATPVQPVQPVQPVYAATPVYSQATPVQPVVTVGTNDSLGKTVLVLGIVAVACCILWFFSIASIICGAIGLSKAKKFAEECGQLYGVAKVGKYLSLGGLIGGCVITGIVALEVMVTCISYLGQSY